MDRVGVVKSKSSVLSPSLGGRKSPGVKKSKSTVMSNKSNATLNSPARTSKMQGVVVSRVCEQCSSRYALYTLYNLYRTYTIIYNSCTILSSNIF